MDVSSKPSRLKPICLIACLLIASITTVWPQRELSGAAAAKLALDKLNVVGSVLMIAAHPDDENTAMLAYLARHRKVRTGYLSLTRGEGGQNLIGPEQGDELGVIRTQELLAARRVDGAEQFFTRAIDFGFKKTPQEAFDKWGREKILSDVVWVIRRFRPDVIILRFTGTPRDGHGQHQASAILGREAFSAAADPKRFPEQLRWVEPWQTKRLLNNSNLSEEDLAKEPRKIAVDPGEYDPVLGHSYAEIAGMSRSLHRSQGMGTAERRGAAPSYLLPVAGDAPDKDLFDGIDISWNRILGGSAVGKALSEAAQSFDPEHPERTLPLLTSARNAMSQMHSPLVDRKRQELDETIALCSGLWLDATADKYAAVPGGAFKVNATALARRKMNVGVESIDLEGIAHAGAKAGGGLPFNQPKAYSVDVAVPSDAPLSQPYWLREPKQGDTYGVSNQTEIGLAENPPLLTARFHIRLESGEIEIDRPVLFRYIERAQGELTRGIVIVPPVALKWSEPAILFPSSSAKSTELQLTANVAQAEGSVRIQAPDGWRADTASPGFHLTSLGEESTISIRLTPPAQDSKVTATASASVGNRTVAVDMETIRYPHIPPQVLFPPTRSALVRADVRLLAKNLGYVMGAGDEVPEALRQMGAEVTLLGPDDLARGNLQRFDAIVAGVRAYNTRVDLRANQQRLLDYVRDGGTLVVQYNVPDGGAGRGGRGPGRGGNAAGQGRGGNGRGSAGGAPPESLTLARIGPYPLTPGGDRVTVEDAPVALPDPQSPLLHKPNEITSKDFDGWVQERGLYFASEWDKRYQPLLETHDPGEKPLLGSTLYARYGRGAYVFTSLSWFRQLPAGVPGAFRIFANLLSAGKTL